MALYDNNNPFAKIIRGEIPCDMLLEGTYCVIFHDINPQAKGHLLIVPKGFYTNFEDFLTNADETEILGFFKEVKEFLNKQNIKDGFRIITNQGKDAGQEIEHLHFHLLYGERLGSLKENPIS